MSNLLSRDCGNGASNGSEAEGEANKTGGGKILGLTIKGGCYNKVSLRCIQLSGENREGVRKCQGGGGGGRK